MTPVSTLLCGAGVVVNMSGGLNGINARSGAMTGSPLTGVVNSRGLSRVQPTRIATLRVALDSLLL